MHISRITSPPTLLKVKHQNNSTTEGKKLPDIFKASKEEIAVALSVTDPPCTNSTTRQNPLISSPDLLEQKMQIKILLDLGHTKAC